MERKSVHSARPIQSRKPAPKTPKPAKIDDTPILNDGRVRLQKVIADGGITSRRKAEQYILQGRVSVNGTVIRELGTRVHPSNDLVQVDGQSVDPDFVQKIYVLFHKPRGCVTTLSDPEGRSTVMDFLKSIPQRIYPVGRLDYYSEGLLLLTNDGDMANTIMHPRHEVTKVYEVKVFGRVNDVILKNLRKGTMVDGDFLQPVSVRVLKLLPNKTWLEFRLNEGKNREIRRLCENYGLTIDKLKRVAIGNLAIDGIAPGNFNFLTKRELENALCLSHKAQDANYVSAKKTLKLKKDRFVKGKLAVDEVFVKYRREHYLKTMDFYKHQNNPNKIIKKKDEDK